LLEIDQASASGYSRRSFRVEEYKKPEFEVTVDAPTVPVMLARRSPPRSGRNTTSARRSRRPRSSTRSTAPATTSVGIPPAMDWLFGSGYWCTPTIILVSRLAALGCPRPMPFCGRTARSRPNWWPTRTSRSGRRHGEGRNRHRTGQSHPSRSGPELHDHGRSGRSVAPHHRRLGHVLVARQPFKVYAWVDRGYYRVGDTIHAHLSARTLDGKPSWAARTAAAADQLQDGKPIETPVQTWPSIRVPKARPKSR